MKYNFVNIFFEADGVGGGSVDNGGTGAENGGGAAETGKSEDTKPNDDLDRLLQSRLDKAMAEERKKTAALNKELEKMKRDKMTADELKKYDDEQRDKALAEREKSILDKENRYYAITAIKKAGLDDGGDTALKIVDLVVGNSEDETNTKVAALKELVNKMVDTQVSEKFKAAGRTPGSPGGISENDDKDKDTLVKKMGQEKAARSEKSNKILNYYLGR